DDRAVKQRDALLVLGAVVMATLVAAILFAGSLASASSADRGARRPGIFFDPRNSPPPIRTLVEEQRGAPIVLQPIVPLQRGLASRRRPHRPALASSVRWSPAASHRALRGDPYLYRMAGPVCRYRCRAARVRVRARRRGDRPSSGIAAGSLSALAAEGEKDRWA